MAPRHGALKSSLTARGGAPRGAPGQRGPSGPRPLRATRCPDEPGRTAPPMETETTTGIPD
eukprot:1341443-Pyramimonas_sp.AAC.1